MKKQPLNKLALLSLVAALITILSPLTISCTQEAAKPVEKIGVAVTILPQAEFVENVGGEKVEVTVMVPPGASPHTYEPSPSQMVAVSEAKMYAKVGSGINFELAWMDKLAEQNKEMLVIDCCERIQLQETGVHNGSIDPHIWVSPVNAKVMVQNICDGLMQIDPSNADYYRENCNSYLQELSELDEDIREGLSKVTNPVFMVYHPAFGYFAHEYGLTMIPIEKEGKEPTAEGLLHLIEQAKRYNIKVIFASPQFNPESARVIADAIEGKVILVDPLKKDYLANMQTLLGELIQVME
ncbi:MAG: zinc ABC transporter substrate-binding protein [Dehalococcoidia bacterium]|nr:zinc ABC transporter substrate-binding protein [Dehalococcoidia bacterium]